MTTLVLLIDSDIPYMVNIKKALEDTGEYHVSLAANVTAAIDALRRVAHDAAVVDFEASDRGDVMELLQTLRQTQPGLPVIIAPRTDAQHERAQYLDVQGVIARPYTARSLMPYVQDVLRRGRPHAQIAPPEPIDHVDDLVHPEIPAALRDLFPEETASDRLLDDDERRRLREQLEFLESDNRPATPDAILDEFEAIERAQTGALDDLYQTRPLDDADRLHAVDPHQTRYFGDDDMPDNADAGQTRYFGDDEIPDNADAGQTRYFGDDEIPDNADVGQTLYFGDEDVPGAGDQKETQRFDDDDVPASAPDATELEWQQPPHTEQPETQQLGGTDRFDTRPERSTEPFEPRPDEPPVSEGDTPTIPEQDLDGVHQFLTTDSGEHDSSEFGEVLDAVARSQPSDFERSPDDRAFHDLVDSMRGPEEPDKGRTWLDELLTSIAADASRDGSLPEAGGTLDYVLDVIRQTAQANGLTDESELDDTTIGEVIDGLFEPSFEGVLAALSGEEIDVASYEEPSYESDEAEGLEPDDGDHVAPDEMSDEDRPAWLSLYETEEVEPPPTVPEEEAAGEEIEEPSVAPEDSSKYPATAALSAAESDDDFSFDDLLRQIESQLPPNLARRPNLKPLPSWGTKALRAPDINALFDRAEGIQPERPEPPELAAALSDAGPQMFEEEEETVPDDQDTRPSLALREEIESASFQDRDTQPYGPIIPDEARARPIEVWEDSAAPSADDIPMLSMDDLMAMADLPAEAGTQETQTEIARRSAHPDEDRPPDEPDTGYEAASQGPAELPFTVTDDEIVRAFYAGVRREQEREPLEPDERFEPADVEPVDVEPDIVEPDIVEPDIVELDTLELDTVEPDTVEPSAIEPDDDHLIPVPVEQAARLLEGDMYIDEEAEIAQAAVQLTQFSLESSAQATMLSRPGELLAVSGDLPDSAALFKIVDDAWQSATTVSDSLIRFITLPEVGEFLLYSAQVENGMALSMVFHADTPVRAIRRQARRLSESLDLVPETPEPPAAKTTPSRPTGIRPPEGLRETVAEEAHAASATISQPTAEESGPTAAYTCLWLPFDPGLEMQGDLVSGLSTWLQDITHENAWELRDLDISPDYLLLTVSVPQRLLADDVMTRLMEETSRLSADHFPDLVSEGSLWADGYYVVSPARPLTEREIARFVTYQRQSQLG
jgi:DNA-binding NarL/FixJ family response regulator